MTWIHPSAVSCRTQISFDAQFLEKSSFCLFVHYHLFIIIIAEAKGHLLNFLGPQPSRAQTRFQSPIYLPLPSSFFQSRLCFAYTQKLIKLNISTLMMEAACTSETSAISPTCTWCSNPRTELASVINRCESLQYLYICISVCGVSKLWLAGHVRLLWTVSVVRGEGDVFKFFLQTG